MAPYSNTYITPVCTMPSVTRLAHALGACGSVERFANGASNNTPVLTWISAIKCGGVPVKRLMISAAIA
ncbi:hypothetical protein D3C86_1622220 [compost metagenome]